MRKTYLITNKEMNQKKYAEMEMLLESPVMSRIHLMNIELIRVTK